MRKDRREKTVTHQIRFVLRKLLTKANITYSKLAKILKIPNATLYQLLNDANVSPRIETLRPIAKYFNITIDQLIGDSPLDGIKQPIINEKDTFREWRPELFKNSIDEVTKVLNQKKQVISLDKALRITKEIYLYFLSKNEKRVDKDFVLWVIENPLNK